MERPASKDGHVTLGVMSFPIFRGVLLCRPRLDTALLTCLLPIRPGTETTITTSIMVRTMHVRWSG